MSERLTELERFFRGEEADWGREGDYNDWSPERTAIELIRKLRKEVAEALRASPSPDSPSEPRRKE